jgi:membrane protease YdiL (CAAX protease family)
MKSLGVLIKKNHYLRYILYAIIGIVIPVFIVGFDDSLIIEFFEQIIYIGLVEEFFYRGYLMNRFSEWLGKYKGCLISSSLFGLGHIISQLAQMGFSVWVSALIFGLQTFIGGIIFGIIFIKAENIWPGAIIHISVNMYLNRILALLG